MVFADILETTINNTSCSYAISTANGLSQAEAGALSEPDITEVDSAL